jgi:hypothetical protein
VAGGTSACGHNNLFTTAEFFQDILFPLSENRFTVFTEDAGNTHFRSFLDQMVHVHMPVTNLPGQPGTEGRLSGTHKSDEKYPGMHVTNQG